MFSCKWVKMGKKLSIITICYNEPEVEKTCESIVNQTWQDFEWIVIDGGSNKETLDVFNRYKDRIDIFISEKDGGRYEAMNKGIKLASGKYLNFLNAGDSYFYNDVLKDIFKDKDWEAGVLYGNENFDYDSDKCFIEGISKKITKDLLYKSTIRHQSSFIRKELFDKYGKYNEENKVVSDYEKWFVFLENNVSFEFIPYIVANFNMLGISCNKKSQDIAIAERKKIIKKYFSGEEIRNFKRNKKKSLRFAEKIFSLKNKDKIHKVLTILGIQIKIRRSI